MSVEVALVSESELLSRDSLTGQEAVRVAEKEEIDWSNIAGASLGLVAKDFIQQSQEKAPALPGYCEQFSPCETQVEEVFAALAMSLDPVELSGKKDSRSLGIVLPETLTLKEIPFLWDIFVEALALPLNSNWKKTVWQTIKAWRWLYSNVQFAEIKNEKQEKTTKIVDVPTADLFGLKERLDEKETKTIESFFNLGNLNLLLQAGFLDPQTSVIAKQLEKINPNNKKRITDNVIHILAAKVNVAWLIKENKNNPKGIDKTAMVLALAAWKRQLGYYQQSLEKELVKAKDRERQTLEGQLQALKKFLENYQLIEEELKPAKKEGENVFALNRKALTAVESQSVSPSDFVPEIKSVYEAAFPGGLDSVKRVCNGQEFLGAKVDEWIFKGGLIKAALTALHRLQWQTLAYRLAENSLPVVLPSENWQRKLELFLLMSNGQVGQKDISQQPREAQEKKSSKEQYFSQLSDYLYLISEKSCFLETAEWIDLIIANCLRQLGENREVLSALRKQKSLLELPFLVKQAEIRGLISSEPETGEVRLAEMKKRRMSTVKNLVARVREVLNVADEQEILMGAIEEIMTSLYNLYFKPLADDIREPELKGPIAQAIIGKSGSGKTMTVLSAIAEFQDALKEAGQPEPLVVNIESSLLTPEGIKGQNLLSRIGKEVIKQMMLRLKKNGVDVSQLNPQQIVEYFNNSGLKVIIILDEFLNVVTSASKSNNTLIEMAEKIAKEALALCDPLKKRFIIKIDEENELVLELSNRAVYMTGSCEKEIREIKKHGYSIYSQDGVPVSPLEIRKAAERMGTLKDLLNRSNIIVYETDEKTALKVFAENQRVALETSIKRLMKVFNWPIKVVFNVDWNGCEKWIKEHFADLQIRAATFLAQEIFNVWLNSLDDIGFPSEDQLREDQIIVIDQQVVDKALKKLSGELNESPFYS